jgi:hypothetical protein
MADGKPGRPATGQVPVRTIRLGQVWDDARAAAKLDDEAFASFVERALRAEMRRRARLR